MIEWLVLGLFCAGLLLCLVLQISVMFALLGGLAVFLIYGRYKGFSVRELWEMLTEGVKTVSTILIALFLIAAMTALWRAAGTVSAIICYASVLIRPRVFLLMTFLLNCGVSVLTGTSFGTAATMGVICTTMGAALGIDLRLLGGAVLSGAFFGDRCSPVSTSALLVAAVTGTDIYDNIRHMLRTAVVPFVMTCGLYLLLGFSAVREGEWMDLPALFGREFRLHPVSLIPAAVILVMALLRVNVKAAMAASLVSAIPVCLFLQHVPPAQILSIAVTGFRAADAQVGQMMNGGGFVAMVSSCGIVCISASYSGIFRKTGLLDGARNAVEAMAQKTTDFAAMLVTSVLASMIACNQTLAVMLAEQLCRREGQDPSVLAIHIEDTAIVVSPMIPWCIAGSVPLATIGVPQNARIFAFFLWILPFWGLAGSVHKRLVDGKTER